jgi:hypothetical protein
MSVLWLWDTGKTQDGGVRAVEKDITPPLQNPPRIPSSSPALVLPSIVPLAFQLSFGESQEWTQPTACI